jgi:hypothetical protein
LLPLVEAFAVAPIGSSLFLWLEIFIVIPCFGAALFLPVAPLLFLKRSWRAPVAHTAFVSGLLLASTYIGLGTGKAIRHLGFDHLARRSAPLVQAIVAYTDSRGAPPDRLSALVPDFLPAVPRTGIAAYPDYEYVVGDAAAQYDANPWALIVFAPSGGSNFDQFMYFPRQNYPERGYGGALERIRDWAYVHE